MSGDERITGRPAPVRVPEFDEDAPPRPVAGVAVDLSGNYRDDPWGWIGYGARKWGAVFLEFVLFVLVMSIGTACWGFLFHVFCRPPLIGQAFRASLMALRDEPHPWKAFTQGYVRPWTLIGSSVLQLAIWFTVGFIVLSIAVLGNVADVPRALGPDAAGLLTWFIVLLLAAGGIYLHIRLSFANSLIVDQRMTIRESYAASWQLTRGHVIALTAFYFLLGSLFVAGLMAFGVGLFFTVPLISLAEASLYLHATGQAGRSRNR